MASKLKSTTGIKISIPDTFSEAYNAKIDARYYGEDNLYPQHIEDFYNNSPSFNQCASRLAEFLFGEGTNSTLIDNKILRAILRDYSIFNGFALHIQYNGLGDISAVSYVPFSSIRLGEQGENGKYTYCYYCADWSAIKTVNRVRVKPTVDKKKYWVFNNNMQTRLNRIAAADGNYDGEILYYSNTISYPIPTINSVLNYASSEVGMANLTYRDVRASFVPSAVLAIPKASDEDIADFNNQLADLQGDTNSFKILTLEFNSQDDKPEVLPLIQDAGLQRYQQVIEDCKTKIVSAYHQEPFLRLADGSLGFGSEAISQIYKYYNFSLKTVRTELVDVLKQVDPLFELKELVFPTDENIVVEENV